jgi:hypothetical protein
MHEDTQKALAGLQTALRSPMAKAQLFALLNKDANSTFHQATSAISGITAYDLEAPALSLYPVNTPLRNLIPRTGGGTGIQANWRAITAINGSGVRPGVSPGNRNAVIPITTTDYTASFKGLGSEVNTDFEAQYAAKGFDDPRALATLTGLRNLMLQEELIILGGNNSVALGTTPTPTATDAATGGSLLHNQQYSIIAVALTLEAFRYGVVGVNGVQGSITRTNADSSSDTFGGGAAAVSANVLHTTASSPTADTYTITASVTPVTGAAGYAWYIATSAGSERIVAITGNATVTITALPAGTNQLATALGASDNSTDSLVFDGLLTQAAKTGSNSYLKAISTAFTADNAGGIKEIDSMLKDRWDNYQLGPTDFWFGSQVALDLGKAITAAGSTGGLRFTVATDMEKIAGGIAVQTYRNKFSMSGVQDIKLHLHPNMPPGILLATASTIPYPLSGVGNVIQVRTRQEYNQIDWPLRSRKWESGVYCDEVLQHYFPPSMGVLSDIRAT